MSCVKGSPKTGGRKKGSVNKVTKDLGGKIDDVINEHIDHLGSYINNIVDPEKKVQFLIKLIDMRLPKLQAIALSTEKKVVDLRSELAELASTES